MNRWIMKLSENRSRYYFRLFWLGFLCICFPILVGGLVFYHSTTTRLLEQQKLDSESKLLLMMNQTEREMQQIEKGSLEISVDAGVNHSFLNPDFKTDLSEQAGILKTLTLFKVAQNSIQDILYYNHSTGTLISHERGSMLTGDLETSSDADKALAYPEEEGWTFLPQGVTKGLISYVRKLPVMHTDQASGTLIIHADMKILFPEQLRHHLLFIFDRQKNLIYRSDSLGAITLTEKEKELLNNSNQPAITRALRTVISQGPEGNDYLYSMGTTKSERVYMLGIPEAEMIQQLDGFKWWFAGTVLIFLVVGFVLSYIGSKYAYNPIAELRNRVARLNKTYEPEETEDEIDYITACIGYLNQEKEKLDAYIKGKEPTLREGLLQKLLDGNLTNGSQIRQECEDYRILYDSCYMVVIIYIEKLYKENRFQSGEDHLISFAVQNVMEELLQLQQLTGYIVGIEQGKNTVLLAFADEGKEEAAAAIAKKYAAAVIQSLQQYMKFTASAGIGGLYASIANVSASYQEAESALLNRLENKADHVYEWKEIKETKQEVFFMYPFELEHDIIRCLELDDLKAAELQFSKFTEAVIALHAYQAVTQCYLLLLSSLIQSLERHRGGTGELYKTNLFDSMKERQTSEEIQEWFVEILFPMYHNLILSDKNPMGKVAVQHICRYIKEHISEDLSLVHSSELVGMSTAHISRLFKKELGVNYIEYLTACKLDEAKRLLVETEDQVSEIAKKVGYTDRSLNRVFRAKLDMPPLQYRTKFR